MQELKGLIDKSISVEDLNPLPATDRTVNKQTKKSVKIPVNDSINQLINL